MLKVNVLEFERGNENGQITAVMEDEEIGRAHV